MSTRLGYSLAVLALLSFVLGFGALGCAHGSKDAAGSSEKCCAAGDAKGCCAEKGACADCKCEKCKTMCAAGKGWCESCKHGCMDGKMVTCKACYDKGGMCATCAAAPKK